MITKYADGTVEVFTFTVSDSLSITEDSRRFSDYAEGWDWIREFQGVLEGIYGTGIFEECDVKVNIHVDYVPEEEVSEFIRKFNNRED